MTRLPDSVAKLLHGQRVRLHGGDDSMLSTLVFSEQTTSNLLRVARAPPAWMMSARLFSAEIAMSAVDKSWETAVGPCFQSAVRASPKSMCGKATTQSATTARARATKATKAKTTRQGLSVYEFKWTKPHVLIVNKNNAGGQLLEDIRSALLESFNYHCQGAVNTGYFAEAWDNATGVAVLVSDCGDSSNGSSRSMLTKTAGACSFMVLGFALLRTYEPKDVASKFKACALPRLRQRMPGNAYKSVLYIDVVCSKLRTAQTLLNIFCGNIPRLDAWKNLLLPPAAASHPYLVLLRALDNVYTYYPLMYGFQRTITGRTMYPIFSINKLKLAQLLESSSKGAATPEDVFGPEYDDRNNLVWQLSSTGACHVYALSATFKDFFKSSGLMMDDARRRELLTSTKVDCADSDTNGYIYGLHVDSAGWHMT